ncbi:MAG: hypothetical protein LBF15_00060 [Candidatus Peribacteria bacterium]|jgi:ATP-dependent DNA helicase RecQ|nr:hypothetical protein [Candidatus Peribacteria bacterium]
MKIKGFLENLSPSTSGRGGQEVRVVALTATATKKVRADIIERLGLENPKVFTKGFERKNIAIIVKEISKKEEKQDKVLEILNKTGGSGIIYCSSRKMVKEVYDFLLEKNIKAGMYTGEMNAPDREREQNNFMN